MSPDASVSPAAVVPPEAVRARRRVAARAVLLALACGCAYLLVAGGFRGDFRQSDHPHHIFMADALWHGQWHVREEVLERKQRQVEREVADSVDHFARLTGRTLSPAQRAAVIAAQLYDRTMRDWAVVAGRKYGYWAPLTPVLMVPFVALWGVDVSDVLINVLFATVNVGLFYWLLWRVDRAGLCRVDEACRVALTLVLAFGTAHFWLACTAQVWFAVQIVTLTPLLAALLAACGPRATLRSCVWSGVFLGAAVLGRNIVILLALFFLLLLVWRWRRGFRGETPVPPTAAHRWRLLAARLTAFGIPLAVAVGLQAAYNHARFGDVRESGLGAQVLTGGHERFVDAFQRHGAFSLNYLPHNAYYYFLNATFPRRATDGRIWIDYEGTSVFLVTPPLLYVFLCWRRGSWFVLALLGGIVPLLAALLLYFATGVVQFGPRYLLDAMPLLLLLTAAGMGGRLTHPGYVLAVAAIAVHLFGVHRFCEGKFAAIDEWLTPATLPALVGAALLGRVWWALGRRRADRACRPAGGGVA